MKQLLLLNPEDVTEAEASNYPVREAARAIVRDADGMFALLHVAKDGYYKLPGGGLDGDEDKIAALRRECMEEIGCDVDVTGEVGSIVEYRKFCELKQTSYCFSAKVKGEKRAPNFTEDEIVGGFEQLWVTREEALRLMQSCSATNIEGREYIVPRDIAFLLESK